MIFVFNWNLECMAKYMTTNSWHLFKIVPGIALKQGVRSVGMGDGWYTQASLSPFMECLNVGTVPTYKMHNIGTVSMFKMHNVGTIPMFKMHNVGNPKIYDLCLELEFGFYGKNK